MALYFNRKGALLTGGIAQSRASTSCARASISGRNLIYEDRGELLIVVDV